LTELITPSVKYRSIDGDEFKKRRKLAGLRMDDIARRCKVSRMNLYNLEKPGIRDIRTTLAKELTKIFGDFDDEQNEKTETKKDLFRQTRQAGNVTQEKTSCRINIRKARPFAYKSP